MPRGASYRPNYDDPQNLSSNAYPGQPNLPQYSREQQPQRPQPSRRAPTAVKVSQTKLSSLLKWLEYRDDNTNKQTPAANAPNTQFDPRALHPASLPPGQGFQPLGFNPQASNFLPQQRSVNGNRCITSYRIDKISRYSLRSSRNELQAQSYSTSAREHVVESIEPRQEPVSYKRTPPWRGGRRGRDRTTPFRQTPSRDTPDRVVTPPPAPAVSALYLSRASARPQARPYPQKLLVVLDLNGALVAREKGSRQNMIKRPGVEALLDYLFKNHVVMVCTSATQHNAQYMVKKLLTEKQHEQLVAIRSRESFGLTPEQYASKVQVYKRLEVIWRDSRVHKAIPAQAQPWSMANTVLIDDSILKAKAEPHNLIQVPEFEYTTIRGSQPTRHTIVLREQAIMKSVQEKLEVLKYQANVASLIRQWQEGEKEAPGIVDEKVDQGKHVGLKDDKQIVAAASYPTPSSLNSPIGPSVYDPADDDDEEEEYEPPEEVELVFRGRQHVGRGAQSSSWTSVNAPVGEKTGPAKGASLRSPSPVTEEDFSWVKKS